jgi:ABC-2 type transport system ATP-binding protein
LEKTAVDEISFSVAPGELIGLIGPNGAGKSTTIKLLTGILKPDSGMVRVAGLDPFADRTKHVRQLGVVFGQRTSLWWDLGVGEALELTAAMFGVEAGLYQERLAWLDSVLGIGGFLKQPVRQLSLGERVRCDLAAALLHKPRFLFLDEPTIGLDVAVKLRLRAFLKELRDQKETTILLTTHDLSEVQLLCPRVLLIAEGKLLHDGPVSSLVEQLGGRRVLVIRLKEKLENREARLKGMEGIELLPPDPSPWATPEIRLEFGPSLAAPELVRGVLDRLPEAEDIRIEEPDIEELVSRFYEKPL